MSLLAPVRPTEPARPTPIATEPWSARAVVVAVAAFATLVVAAPDLFIPDPWLGWVDVWYYVGFAQRLPELLQKYSWLYQADRLGWTLPAYALTRFASPLAANYALKAAFFTLAVAALFGTIRRTSGAPTALLVAALAALHSFFVHSIGAGYVDGPSNAYFLAAIYGATRALSGDDRPIRFGALAGACYACAVFTHSVYVLIAPLFTGYVIVTYALAEPRTPRTIARFLAGCAGGAGAVVSGVLLLYAFWRVPTPPLFASARMMFGHAPNDLIRPVSAAWVSSAWWLVLPTTVTAWTLIKMAAAARAGTLGRVGASSWLLVSMVAFWIALYGIGAPWLMLPFYTSFLLPSVLLALGPILREHVERASHPTYVAAFVAVCALGAASYVLRNARISPAAVVTVTAAAAVIGTYAAGPLAPRRSSPALFIGALIAMLVSVNVASGDYSTQIRNGYRFTAMAAIYYPPAWTIRTGATRAVAYRDVVLAARRLVPRLEGRSYAFWYDDREPLAIFFRSVTSMFFAWSTNDLVDEHFSRLDDKAFAAIKARGASRDLVVLTEAPQLTTGDRRFEWRWTEAFETGGLHYFAHGFVVHDGAP